MSLAESPDDLPVDPDDEQLVAYLDGELDRSQRTALESRLMDDSDLRMRLQDFQQGWDLLEELDVPGSNLKLVESTLELAVADVVQENSWRRGSMLGRFQWPLGIAAACVVGFAMVWIIGSIIESRQYRRQLQDLAIVENLDAYLYGDDIGLMRQLATNDDWRQMVGASGEIGYTLGSINPISSQPLAERESVVAALPLEKRVELKSRWERFRQLAPEVQDRIRATAEIVAKQEDATELLVTMIIYAIWRETIQPPEIRDQIESDDPNTRKAAITEAIQASQRVIAEESSYMLDEATVENIYRVLRQFVRSRVRNGDEQTKIAFEQLKKTAGDEDPIDRALAMTVLRGDELGPYRPEPLTESELKWVRAVLSTEAEQKLAGITGGFPPLETMTLRIWAEEAVRRRYRRPSSATTLERYRSLTPQQRDALDLQPPEKILESLTD